MTRSEWLEERRTMIGASDAPNIIGIGFRDAMSVYQSKINPVGERPPSDLERIGIELEPVVGRLYAEKMDVSLEPCGYNIIRHPERSWQGCTPDFRRADHRYVQCKTLVNFDDEWGASGSAIVPDDYRLQVTQEMGCTGTDSIDIAALCRITGEFRVYRLEFDAKLFDWLTEVEARFWQCVQSRTPPPDNWHDDVQATASVVFVKGKAVALGANAVDVINRRQVFKAIIDEAKAEYDRLTGDIEVLLGDAQIATAGNYKVKRVCIPGAEYTTTRKPHTRIDVRAIKERIKS